MAAASAEKEVFLNEPVSLAHAAAELQKPSTHSKRYVWYLAYGSNMNTKVLTGRRGVKPIESRPCECESLLLSFELRSAFAYTEPCFATVLDRPAKTSFTASEIDFYRRRTGNPPLDASLIGKDPQSLMPPHLHGVIHKITMEEYEMIRRTEGGGGHDDFGYVDKHVVCTTYNGEKIPAVTLVIFNKRLLYPDLQASARYLNVIREGARQHNVDEAYCKYLDTLEPYRATTIRHKIGKWLMIVLLFPVILFFLTVFVGTRTIGIKRRLPWALYWFIEQLGWSIFWCHDHFYSYIFGNGYNSMVPKKVTMKRNPAQSIFT
eukprot:TRINITY_DN22761_c0_g1_i1.p1 TRINITY_DN22761_c0_g1~~TRINITY_DN22761_c0_g1_i1.p1  ORF type:complete len:319 (-),score=49.18 TRINITY_DN22761_c0_g1_i1:33-989(-)